MANRAANHSRDDPLATNGHHGHTHHQHDSRPAPMPPAAATTKKGKQKKAVDSNEASKLVAARISQLELDAAGEKDQEAEIEREVKKASRELSSQTSRMDNAEKIDHLTRRCVELLAELKRHERESIKNKKRADQLQKEKDHSRTELGKTVGLKEKLEKLCRELQKENNKLKNENKTMSDNQVRNHNSWDEKYATLLGKLDDSQDAKDNPRQVVIDPGIEEVFRVRFKTLIEQYELRELHFHSQMRCKELEVQVHLARAEEERKTKEDAVAKGEETSKQNQRLQEENAGLRKDVGRFSERFHRVEDSLSGSNGEFSSLRGKTEAVVKKMERLDRENSLLKKQNLKLASIMKDVLGKHGRVQLSAADNAVIEAALAGRVSDVDGDDSEHVFEDGEDKEAVTSDDVDSDDNEKPDDDATEDEQEAQRPQKRPPSYGPERPPPQAASKGRR